MGLFSFLKKDDDIVKDVIRPDMPNGSSSIIGDGLMVVEDVFMIRGRGVVVTGKISSGSFAINDSVKIVKESGETIDTAITGIEAFRKTLNEAYEGDNVGLLLHGIKRDQVQRGDRIEK